MYLGTKKIYWKKISRAFVSFIVDGLMISLLTTTFCYAQGDFNNWSIGIRGGSSITKMNINSKILPVYGLNIRYAASPYIAIQGNFDFGRFKSINPLDDSFNRSFRNDYYQYSLTGDINFLRLFNAGNISRRLSIYGLLGVGQIFSNVKTYINNKLPDYRAYQGQNNKEASILAVGGAGLRLNVTHRLDFFMQYEYTYTGSAYIDGYNYSSHLNKDRYTFLSSGISIKLGKKENHDADWETQRTVWQNRLSTYEGQMNKMKEDFTRLNESYQARLANLELKQNDLTKSNDVSKETFMNLSQELKKTQIMKISTDTGIESQISILFAFDSSEILPQAEIMLNNMVQNLKKYTDINLNIVGYTDSTGSNTYNQNLSKRRAYAIRSYLVDNGINSERIKIKSLGEYNPVASNKNILGRKFNRRVEIIFMR